MNKFDINNNRHNTFSKVMRFGADLFSPVIPPPTFFEKLSTKSNTLTNAVNPQDIVFNQNQLSTTTTALATASAAAIDYEKEEIEATSVYTINPRGYIETVKSPYSNLGDVFFDVSSCCDDDNSTFSISNNGSSSNSSNNTICNTQTITTTELSLPPSSTILQSELNKSSLDYFILNNSFLEEIKFSLSIKQQQYINSGITNSRFLQPSPSCMTNSSQKFDLSHILTSQQNSLFTSSCMDIFDEDASSVSLSSITSQSIYEKSDEVEEEDKSDELSCKQHKDKENVSGQEKDATDKILNESHKILVQSPDNFIINKSKTTENDQEGQEYNKDKNKKRKRDEGDNMVDNAKKSRKNYNSDTINVLMDWFLQNNGKAPSNATKKKLAIMTGKSDVQISTWFQNARRRYLKKLELFKTLSGTHPTLIYDYQSLKSYLKLNNNNNKK